MKGTVFNIQRFSLFDGPGVRTVVFLKGCPLNCIWCHNPEGKNPRIEIMFDPARCIACGDCAKACVRGGHIITADGHGYVRDNCIACGSCAEGCYSGALEVAGREMEAEEVIREVLRDSAFFKESGGGMTLSGGEPLYQGSFACELLKLAKENGISTCVETCGFASPETLTKAAKYTDIFYFDYKATGDERHRELCKASNKVILDNLSLLDKLGNKVTLRCPIVPTLNETDEHIMGIAETAKNHPSVKEVHLEPYHRLGIMKSEKLGEDISFSGNAPDKEKMKEYVEKISAYSNKNCIIS